MRLVAVLALVGAAAPAVSASVPSVAQYVEAMPSGGPSEPIDLTGEAATLPPAVEQRLDLIGTPSASTLLQVATSPSFGAPQEGLARPAAGPEGRSGIAAAGSTVVENGGPALVVALLVLATAAAAALGARRKARRA